MCVCAKKDAKSCGRKKKEPKKERDLNKRDRGERKKERKRERGKGRKLGGVVKKKRSI